MPQDEIVSKQKEYYRRWYAENKDRVKEKSRQWRENNRDRHRNSVREWKKKNKEKYLEYMKMRFRKARININSRMSALMRLGLKRNKAGYHWETLVPYNLEQLMSHLEKQFLPGMTWENRGEWHIDHIIPKSAFNYEKHTDIDFQKCWALSNLQPMWAKDNLRKYNKTEKPHQPSLMISI